MYQTCQYCSYESPIGARFCRQCGVQLYAETEASAAGTRNFDKQEPALSVATAGSGHLPPSVADAIAGETARYYQAQPYVPAPPASSTAPIKSRIGNWRWFMLLLVIIIGAAIGSLVTMRAIGPGEDSRPPEERARRQQQDEDRRRQQG